MAGEPERQRQEDQTWSPPPRPQRRIIIRVFRAFQRYENRKRRRREENETPHERNERIMAQWARRVGWFTLALVVVGVVSACIFGNQLSVMQGQLNEMRAETRPYVNFDGVQFYTIRDSQKGTFQGFMFPKWINNGATTTAKLSDLSGCSISPQEIDEPFDKIPFANNHFFQSVLGPKQAATTGSPCPVIGQTEMDAINAGSQFWYFCGVARYQEGADRATWHETQYCRRLIEPHLSDDGKFLRANAYAVGAHNCADTECPGYNPQKKPFD